MEDLGNVSGAMTFEWLEEKLVDFGCSINESAAEEILQKCNFYSLQILHIILILIF